MSGQPTHTASAAPSSRRGASCVVATCHCYIGEEWIDKISTPDDDEESMLDQAFDIKKNSRLSCQIPFSEELDGITLTLAPKF